MRYFWGVAVPVLLQCLLVAVIIGLNTGNGSWLGLAALLVGMLAIPATAIANFLIVRYSRGTAADVALIKCYGVALVAPVFSLVFFFFA